MFPKEICIYDRNYVMAAHICRSTTASNLFSQIINAFTALKSTDVSVYFLQEF